MILSFIYIKCKINSLKKSVHYIFEDKIFFNYSIHFLDDYLFIGDIYILKRV